MKIRNKKRKIFGTLATTLALTSMLGYNVFANSLTIQKMDNSCLFISSNGTKTDHSNYAYFLSGQRAYTYTPWGTVKSGAQYGVTGTAPETISWVIRNIYNEQIKQAAIWLIQGAPVQSTGSVSMSEVQAIVEQANDALKLQNDAQNLFLNKIGDYTYVYPGSEIFYETEMDSYVSTNFDLGYFEKVTIDEGYSAFDTSLEEPYFERYVNGKFEKVNTEYVQGIGTYRIVIPRKAVTKTSTVRVLYTHSGIIYEPASLWTDGASTQDMVTPNYSEASTGVVAVEYGSIDKMYLTGDLNQDGYINSTDAAMVLDLFKNGGAKKLDYNLGDLNGDNLLNSTDASMVLDIFKSSNK